MKPNKLNIRILLYILFKKRLDKRNKAKIALTPRGAINMNDIICLGDFSEHEEIIHNRINEAAPLLKRILMPISVCHETRELLKEVREWFFNKNYQQLANQMLIEDMREIIPTLVRLIKRQDAIIAKLEQIRYASAKPFVRIAIKNLKSTNHIFEDKIQDFALAANTEFIEAAEKILDGALNHNLDIDRVPKLGSFV